MKAMHFDVEKTIAWAMGVCMGGIAYASRIPFLNIDFSLLLAKLLSLLWAGTVAAFTGAAGVIGKRAVDKVIKYYKNKKNKP
jgi:hypothetical protein